MNLIYTKLSEVLQKLLKNRDNGLAVYARGLEAGECANE